MDQFNYLAVLISIILGLGITQLLSGFGRWVEQRSSFRAYGPSVCWAAILLVTHVQTWWSMFTLREQEEWTFLEFWFVLLPPIILYLLSILVLPGATSTGMNLRESYYAQRRWFFGLLMALLLASISKDIVLTGSLPEAANLVFHTLLFVLSGIALFSEREAFHKFLAYASAASVAIYIWLLFGHLQ
ncbi:MAG TPA: hypothetical protein PLF92_05725 [Arenimonas sp.]|jgi:hypothetical protein|nr:hypothetical protein [Arenimonas sp.]HPW32391.1 hypothetical protein [Arenimonas sp.]